MSDDAFFPEEQQDQPSAAPHPYLQNLAEGLPEGVVTKVNDYFQRRKLADANEAAGEKLVSDVTRFKDGLVGMVRNDPHAVHMAMDIIPDVLASVIGTIPNLPDDAADHHTALSGQIQREVAAEAVTAMANRHEGSARTMLSGLSDVLSEHVEGLSNYITLQADARTTDTEARAARAAEQQAFIENRSAVNYLNALYNPITGKPRFPEAWNQAVMADASLSPSAKLGVTSLYNHLRDNGDVDVSNPRLVADAVSALARGDDLHPADIVQHAGDGLRMADALRLANGALDPESRGHFKQLDAVLTAARREIASPENGAAGQSAFGRFVKDIMDNGADLNPGSKTYVLANGVPREYQPSAADLTGVRFSRPRSLEQIFAGAHEDILGKKINRIMDLEEQRREDEAGGSGRFFRDLLEKGGGATIPLVPGPGESES